MKFMLLKDPRVSSHVLGAAPKALKDCGSAKSAQTFFQLYHHQRHDFRSQYVLGIGLCHGITSVLVLRTCLP